jgi:hypothetical protein
MYSSEHTLPEHPGKPKWQSFTEWNKMKAPQSVQIVKSEQETQEETFEKFGLIDEGGQGWGDATNAEDAGWGLPQNGGGW